MSSSLRVPVGLPRYRGKRPLPIRTPVQRDAFRRKMAGRVAELRCDADAPATVRGKESHWDFWIEYCAESGTNAADFALSKEPSVEERGKEEDTLIALLVFTSECPRDKVKQKNAGTSAGRNSIAYAASIVSTIRRWYEERSCRAVGLRDAAGKNCARYHAIRKSLAKLGPEERAPRQPILAKHMRKLHAVLDLESSHRDRAFWCVALSCWLGVRRVGDYLATDEEMRRGWRPRYRTHRGRYEVRPQKDGEDLLVIRLKPPKEDPEGKRYHEAVYKTSLDGEALSGGNAWRDLLQNDPSPAGVRDEDVPIFRDPASGAEYAKSDFKTWAGEKFAAAGLGGFGTATHSFRIGGATTLAEVGGETAARGVGGWLSRAILLYIHMSHERRVELGGMMVAAPDIALRTDSRPVGRRA